jgi:transposase InsO family protein
MEFLRTTHILHFNVTRFPTSTWIVQQLREAFPYDPPTRFLILYHDAKYGNEVPAAIRSMDITAIRTMVGCPWQNGVGERWVGSCRRELLDDLIAPLWRTTTLTSCLLSLRRRTIRGLLSQTGERPI